MKNIKDIFESKEVDYGDAKRKWIVFKEDFLKANKKLVMFASFQNNDDFRKILLFIHGKEPVLFIKDFKENSEFSDASELKINTAEELGDFYNKLYSEYHEYNLFFSKNLEMFALMDDDDNFHIVCTKDKLKQIFELEYIFENDSYMYQSHDIFKGYHQIVLRLYADYFLSKRITIDDFRLLQPAPEGYWKDGEWILKEDPKKDSSVDNK